MQTVRDEKLSKGIRHLIVMLRKDIDTTLEVEKDIYLTKNELLSDDTHLMNNYYKVSKNPITYSTDIGEYLWNAEEVCRNMLFFFFFKEALDYWSCT